MSQTNPDELRNLIRWYESCTRTGGYQHAVSTEALQDALRFMREHLAMLEIDSTAPSAQYPSDAEIAAWEDRFVNGVGITGRHLEFIVRKACDWAAAQRRNSLNEQEEEPEIDSTGVLRARLLDSFIYSADTGDLIWDRGHRVGSVAGYIDQDGYRAIKFGGRMYKAHRLVWLYHNGEFPSGQIDHINQVKMDNRIENLRDATPSENQRNKALRPENTSGFHGVYQDKRSGKWVVRIRDMDKTIYGGSFDCLEDAAAKRKEMDKKYGFHPNHGGVDAAIRSQSAPAIKEVAPQTLQQIREAFYAYRSSEGCGCCENVTAHAAAEDLLGRLLGVARYPDDSGADWATVLPSAQADSGRGENP